MGFHFNDSFPRRKKGFLVDLSINMKACAVQSGSAVNHLVETVPKILRTFRSITQM